MRNFLKDCFQYFNYAFTGKRRLRDIFLCIFSNQIQISPLCILLEFIIAPDAQSLSNKIDIIGDTEIVLGFIDSKSLVAVVADRHQPPRSGLGRLLQAFMTKLAAALWKPAYGPTAAANRLPAMMLHLPERHPGQLP